MARAERCDVLVVGAGPAGSRAAAAAAGADLSTILIDAKTRIGEQPHCGELIPAPLLALLPNTGHTVIQAVAWMETEILGHGEGWSPGQVIPDLHRATTIKTRRIASRGYLIDRIRFDRDLARQAAAEGATVLCSTRLVGCNGDLWTARTPKGEIAFRPAYVIAADGALSRVASCLGLPRIDAVIGAQVEVPLTTAMDGTYVFLDRSIVGGYGWLFPKGPVANVGVGLVPGGGVRPRTVLEQFVTFLQERGMILRGTLARTGGVIPVSGLRETLALGNVILCGDAAGLTHPITGAGIPQAVVSGDLAGRAVAEAVKTGTSGSLHTYEVEIRGLYGGSLRHGLAKRARMMEQWNDPDFAGTCDAWWIGFEGYRRRVRPR